MQPSTPRRKRSPLLRYAPFIAIIAVLAVIVVAVVVSGGGDDDDDDATNPNGDGVEVPIQFAAAAADGKEGDYTWQDSCDEETGRVSIPTLTAAPCVPEFDGDNGGATSPGVTADAVKIGYYQAPSDPSGEALLKAAGAFDEPAQVDETLKNYNAIFQSMYETYGRKIELVKVKGTGNATDEQAARNDANKAAGLGLFAMSGGPGQSLGFGQTIAAKHILCVNGCIVPQPEKNYSDNAPYMWTGGPSPDQTIDLLIEYMEKQLKDKNAIYAGDESFHNKKRSFALLSYNTPTDQYTDSWQYFEDQLNERGFDLVDHYDYYLNVNSLAQDATAIATRLKNDNATTVIFTGDPLLPRFFTAEATKQKYFPEWLMAGTVLADTSVFGRTFDQEQWRHAWGLQLTPARTPKSLSEAYNLYKWWYGEEPPAENSFGIIAAAVNLIYTGIQSAGPNLTPESFSAGMHAIQPDEPGPGGLRTSVSYGNKLWSRGNDPAGLDNAGIIWWDPDAEGEDETGTEGKGMYQMADGGRRYAPGEWPTDPIKIFDRDGAVTIYNELPDELKPPDYDPPPQAAVNKN